MALGVIHVNSPAVIEALEAAAQDPDRELRDAAANALKSLKEKQGP